jgi:DNA-binding NarL/FixJ family response regulator
MTGLLLVEDHMSLRQSLAFMFDLEPDFTVVAQAGSVEEALGCLGGVDVAIVDIDLPGARGVELIARLREVNPACRALVLTGSASARDLAEAVEAGADGLLQKTAPLEEIIAAARRLASGEDLLAPREVVQMMRAAGQYREDDRAVRRTIGSLTPREREVLGILAEGLPDKEIARRLGISAETARNHVASILSKLGVESRLQAAVYAIRHGAVDPG